MSLTPSKLFLFNSGLPEPGFSPLAFTRLLGPWHHNFRGRNIGNGYISHATLCGLFGKPLKLDHIANGWTAALDDNLVNSINENYSHFLFVMQDFIRESFSSQPFGALADFMEKLKIPIVPISLGANSLQGYDPNLQEKLSADQVRFLKVLADKSAYIGVRGHYTMDVLKRMGIDNVMVTGCPSFFENGSKFSVVRRQFDMQKIVTTGGLFNPQLRRSPYLMQDEIFFINALYLHFSERERIIPDRIDDSPEGMPFEPGALDIAFNLYELAFTDRLRFFTDFNTWRKFYSSNRWCLTVGSRLHSAIQSWNSGVPAIVTNGDARARETCETFKLPNRPDLGPDTDFREIFEGIDIDTVASNYPIARQSYLNYLAKSGINPENYATDGEVFTYPDYPLLKNDLSKDILRSGFNETWEYAHRNIKENQQTALALAEAGQVKVQLLERIGALEQQVETLMDEKRSLHREIETGIKFTDVVKDIVEKDKTIRENVNKETANYSKLFDKISGDYKRLNILQEERISQIATKLADVEQLVGQKFNYDQMVTVHTQLINTVNGILSVAYERKLLKTPVRFDAKMTGDMIEVSGLEAISSLKPAGWL